MVMASESRNEVISANSAALFPEQFNQHSFQFEHHLANHPLFELPRLLALGKKLSATPENIYFNAGKIAIGQRFDESPTGTLTLEQTLERIEAADSWVVLKHTEEDPEYGALYRTMIAEVEKALGRSLAGQYRALEGIILITSPGRVTSYHVDSECNFLFQIRGHKEFSVFDQNDRAVLPETDIETYYNGDHNGAKYREEFKDRATLYRMSPGTAVHVPVLAPHFARNTGNVSVSLSFNFELLAHDRLANVYRFNHLLRRAGWQPQPPGQSAWRDTAKRVALKGVRGVARVRQKLKPASRAS